MPSISEGRRRLAEGIQQGRLIPTVREDFILPNGEEAYVAVPKPQERAVAFLKRVLYRLRSPLKLLS